VPDFVNNPADGYRTLTAKKNYLKGLNWIKTDKLMKKGRLTAEILIILLLKNRAVPALSCLYYATRP